MEVHRRSVLAWSLTLFLCLHRALLVRDEDIRSENKASTKQVVQAAPPQVMQDEERDNVSGGQEDAPKQVVQASHSAVPFSHSEFAALLTTKLTTDEETMWHWDMDLFSRPTLLAYGGKLFDETPSDDWFLLLVTIVICISVDYFVIQRCMSGDSCEDTIDAEALGKLRHAFSGCCAFEDAPRITKTQLFRMIEDSPDVAQLFGLPSSIRSEDGTADTLEEKFRNLKSSEDQKNNEEASITWDEFERFCITESLVSTSPSSRDRRKNLAVLGFWIIVGIAFNAIIWHKRGRTAGITWCSGYLLEWMLSLDNLFVFHLIFKTYATPRPLVHKALFAGVVSAVLFKMFFFMALSSLLHLMHWVRFVFGILLIYSGVQAAREEDDEVDVRDIYAVRGFKWCLGSRLTETYDVGGSIFIRDPNTQQLCATLLVPVIFALEVTDVLFAVDSVSAKVAQIHDYYIAYSSSILAIFGMRAMFFIIQDLVDDLYLMKYGLCFILVFIGVELMVADFVELPVQVVCVVICCVFVICTIGSKLRL